MWFGKLALISYVFSFLIVGGAYLVDSMLGWNLYASVASQDYIDQYITGVHNNATSTTSTSDKFIFGDFYAAARSIGSVLLNALDGGIFANVLYDAPIFGSANGPAMLIIQSLITFCTACLIVNIISGREL